MFNLQPPARFLVAWFLLVAAAGSNGEVFQFHHESVLGTSFELSVRANSRHDAQAVEKHCLRTIEHLRRILSSHDPKSDLGRLNATLKPVRCSRELIELLDAYDQMEQRSGGAYNGRVGTLVQLWKGAEVAGRPPQPEKLQEAVRQMNRPGWEIDRSRGTVRRLGDSRINLDSMGKGYIIEKAVLGAAASRIPVEEILLNIGGDIYLWNKTSGKEAASIGVANPFSHADNAPFLTAVHLPGGAISTSAGYERGYSIQGKYYSHILDPRTGWPAQNALSATVVASHSSMANALATTLCVLGPEAGLRLVQETPGTECLIVGCDGKEYRSPGFAALEPAPAPAETTPPKKPSLWPADFEVTIDISLKVPQTDFFRVKRPYVALWIESDGKPVRTVAFWGNKFKYFRDMPGWWRFAREDPELVRSVTRATRNAGKHQLIWDGRDDKGNPLPPGKYTVILEAAREHGTHAQQNVEIICGKIPAKAEIPAGSEFDAALVTYGPAAKKP